MNCRKLLLASICPLIAYGQQVEVPKDNAESGDSKALYWLACSYAAGKGMPQDGVKAERLMLKAAKAGNKDAQYQIGMAYATNGLTTDGKKQNFPKAVRWFREAAAQGHSGAQYWLGRCYEDGFGTPKDPYKAYLWISAAKMGGYKDANTDLKRLAYEQLSPKRLKEAKADAKSLRESIRRGDNTTFCLAISDILGESEADTLQRLFQRLRQQ